MAELNVDTDAAEAVDTEYAVDVGEGVKTGEESVAAVVVVTLDPVMFPRTGPLGPTRTAVASATPVPVFSIAAKHEG